MGGGAGASPFKRDIEPAGLRPDMSPDPFVKETPVSMLKSITLTQVVRCCAEGVGFLGSLSYLWPHRVWLSKRRSTTAVHCGGRHTRQG